ncbi:hypothetical protein [Bacillus sp. K2I17]|uniref:hypothetical protein n=1 Tax=Bacillus sp. K2I17 TaxID=2014743 RepID=UPI000B515ECC|nr:hypothetical protein [Bacillus sp. K2I17]OWT48453.1 hypothetical protein CER22_25535 [Bacillus sp. K2I17]
MNAAERDHKIGQLKREINEIWKSLSIGSIFVLFIWWFLEPMMKEISSLGGEENEILTTISKAFFDYIIVAIYAIGYITALIAIFMKKRTIRKYKKAKDFPSKINIQKDDTSQNPVYVIDHSKETPNSYEKGDTEMMKRVFNQNNNVSINSGKQNTSKTRSERHSTRAYNGSSRSSNSTESNNIALDIALGSSIYSTGNDNDCSSSSSSSYNSSSSDYSSSSSSCD